MVLFQQGGPRSGERAGRSVGSPVPARYRAMLAGFLMTATSLMRPWQTGQASASTPKVRARSSDQVRYRLLRFFLPASLVAGFSAGSARGTICDLHSLAAPSTPAYLTVWWRGGGTLAARRQSRESGSMSTATVPSA